MLASSVSVKYHPTSDGHTVPQVVPSLRIYQNLDTLQNYMHGQFLFYSTFIERRVINVYAETVLI